MRKPMPFGNYLLLDRIAVGGMAEVFSAKSFGVEGFERILAIKRILPNMVEDEEFIGMFIDEARIAASLQHANIAHIYELGKHDETYYIAMEYVSGRDVRLIIDKFKKKGLALPFPMAAYILAKMAEGLDYAHTKKDQDGHPIGLIHRDISPQNVLVSYDGDVKIIDFGIAKATGRSQQTQAGILKGKFAYMSPEQVRGIAIDSRSDLYSAGVMLYEMVTGQKLFTGESDFSLLEKVRAGDVRAPREVNADIPEQLEQIILKALDKDRDARYQTGAELHDELMRFLFSGREIYSGKNLSLYMKDAFAEEYQKEQERIRRWQETSVDSSVEFATQSATGNSSPGISNPRLRSRTGESGAHLRAAEVTPSRRGSGARLPPPPPSDGHDSTAVMSIDSPVEHAATQVKSQDEIKAGGDATAIINRPTTAPRAAVPKESPAQASEVTGKHSRAAPPPKKRSNAVIAVVVGVVALGAVGAAVFFQMNKPAPEPAVVVAKDPPKVERPPEVVPPPVKEEPKVAEIVDAGAAPVVEAKPEPKKEEHVRDDSKHAQEDVKQTASLDVTSDPPGANIIIDGTKVGVTPATIADQPIGHELEIRFILPGYRPGTTHYKVKGKKDHVQLKLESMTPAPAAAKTAPAAEVKPAMAKADPPAGASKATLKVMCVPRSRILVDNKTVGHRRRTTAGSGGTAPDRG
jgi:serine/threonine protein kinase